MLAACLLTGCSDKDGKIAGKKQVLSAVREVSPKEQHRLISVVHETEAPKKDTYTFASKERNLRFEAVSTLREIWIDNPTGWYNQYIWVGYEEAVHRLYREKIQNILAPIPADNLGNRFCTSYEELEDIADRLCKADVVYSAEKDYNTEEWMKAHPYGSFSLSFRKSAEDSESVPFFRTAITGSQNADFLHAYMKYCYINAANEGRIFDFSIPEEELARTPLRTLDSIWYQDQNLSELCSQDAKEAHLNNQSEDSLKAYYHYAWDAYVVPVDVGLTDGNYAPRWMKTYAKVFGFDLEIDEEKGYLTWTRDGVKWEMMADEDRNNNITGFKVKKNGKKLPLDYLTVNDENSPLHCTYLVGIKAEDLAEILGVTVRIDRENRRLIFESTGES